MAINSARRPKARPSVVFVSVIIPPPPRVPLVEIAQSKVKPWRRSQDGNAPPAAAPPSGHQEQAPCHPRAAPPSSRRAAGVARVLPNKRSQVAVLLGDGGNMQRYIAARCGSG